MPTIEVDESDIVVVLSGHRVPPNGIVPYVTTRVMVGDQPIGMVSRVEIVSEAHSVRPTVAVSFLNGWELTTPLSSDLLQQLNRYTGLLSGVGFVTVTTPWSGLVEPAVPKPATPEPSVSAMPRYDRTVID